MSRAQVVPRVLYDGSAGFAVFEGVVETNLERDLNLIIQPAASGPYFALRVQTRDPELQEAFGDDVEDLLPLRESELSRMFGKCRKTWRDAVVDLVEHGEFPYQCSWDLGDRPDLLAAVLGKVAVAGSRLFDNIFFGRAASAPRLRRIGEVLCEQMARRPCRVKVTSDHFLVPWGLLYSDSRQLDDRGTNARREGFWGYQHLIEQAPLMAGHYAYRLQAADSARLEVGLQIDEHLDREMRVDCLKPVLDLFEQYEELGLRLDRRATRLQLAAALRGGTVAEHILYFCCHAVEGDDLPGPATDDGYLILSDRPADSAARISPDDLTGWLHHRVFTRHPLVFLNACGSAQLDSIFYSGFGKAFLERRASSVLAAETALPAVFAGEFARRFFAAFFEGGAANSVGEVLFRLRRELLDRHNNPLGLIYSLYRGADSFLPTAVARQSLAPRGGDRPSLATP